MDVKTFELQNGKELDGFWFQAEIREIEDGLAVLTLRLMTIDKDEANKTLKQIQGEYQDTQASYAEID